MRRTYSAVVAALAVVLTACSSLPKISVQWEGRDTTTTTSSTTTTSTTTTTIDLVAKRAEQELFDFRRCIDQKIERLYDDTSNQVETINAEIQRWIHTQEIAQKEIIEPAREGSGELGGYDVLELTLQLETSARINELVQQRDQIIADYERQESQLRAVRDGARAGNVDWSLCAGN